jgi:hypothetical protein
MRTNEKTRTAKIPIKVVTGCMPAKGEPAKGRLISAKPARTQAKNKNANLSMLLPPFNDHSMTIYVQLGEMVHEEWTNE